MMTNDLLPHWISQLFNDCPEEAEEDDAWALLLLREEGRISLWVLCSALGVDTRGVPGQACRLLERYLAVQMRIFNNSALNNQERRRLKILLTTKFPLLMASCIQLAAKMNSANMQMSASFIQTCLAVKGVSCTVAEINDSEFQVYKMLGLRIPLWTSVDAADALAVCAGLPQNMLKIIELVVNMAECRRDILDQRVQWTANVVPGCSQFYRVTLRTLHLVAGCVAATAQYVSYKGDDPAPRLAELTRAPVNFIRCVSSCVLISILKVRPVSSTSR